MYVVLVYDIDESRVNKVNKFLKRYLHWIQNSVFEGELTNSQYSIMVDDLKGIIEEEEDSIIIYRCSSEKAIKRITIGVDKNTTEMII